jgi:hypothetical protein
VPIIVDVVAKLIEMRLNQVGGRRDMSALVDSGRSPSYLSGLSFNARHGFPLQVQN